MVLLLSFEVNIGFLDHDEADVEEDKLTHEAPEEVKSPTPEVSELLARPEWEHECVSQVGEEELECCVTEWLEHVALKEHDLGEDDQTDDERHDTDQTLNDILTGLAKSLWEDGVVFALVEVLV